MALYRADGIVLRTRPLGEADKVLVILTRTAGKVEAVARGARRTRSRLLGGTQPFTCARYLLYRGRELDTVSQAEVVEAFRPLREDLGRMALATYAAELVDLLVAEREPAEPVFDLLLEFYRLLAGPDGGRAGEAAPGPEASAADGWTGVDMAVRAFELHLMKLVGFQPELERCARCRGELRPPVRFDPEAGGTTCSACRSGLPCSADGLQWLRRLAQTGLAGAARLAVPAAERAELERLLRAYVTCRTERPVRSLAFLAAVRGTMPADPA